MWVWKQFLRWLEKVRWRGLLILNLRYVTLTDTAFSHHLYHLNTYEFIVNITSKNNKFIPRQIYFVFVIDLVVTLYLLMLSFSSPIYVNLWLQKNRNFKGLPQWKSKEFFFGIPLWLVRKFAWFNLFWAWLSPNFDSRLHPKYPGRLLRKTLKYFSTFSAF